MDDRWIEFLNQESKKEYFHRLKKFVAEKRKTSRVLPAPEQTFKAFEYCQWNALKVIIVGQDPYPTRKDAHGLAFSSPDQQTPYSLENIFEEIYEDYYNGNRKYKMFETNDLTQWAYQGVLLINSCFTTEDGAPGSHKGKGWELFTENLIKYIQEKNDYRMVYMLWGKEARQYAKYIDKEKHLVLEADHPAAAKHNQNAWWGNKHFTKANQFIKKHYFNLRGEINWGTFKNWKV